MQDIYQTFDFYKIQDKLLEYAKTELSKSYIQELKMMSSYEEVKKNLLDLNEMTSIIIRFGPLPIGNSANALRLIDMAKKTGLLTPHDLNLVAEDVLTIEKITQYFKKIDVSYERIVKIATDINDLSNLEREIHRVITPSLTVADNATPELKEIRTSIKKLEIKLQDKIATLAFSYSQYLNDENSTIRDGHFVLPVKTVDKNKVPGIVFDVSDSGATTFIEPIEICNINNEMTSLKIQENEEIRKILKGLTGLVLLQENEILHNNEVIAHLDFLSAKAMYANEIDALVADFSDKQYIDLVDARHPLIDKNKVVSNSFHLDEDKRIIVISGPNAGGKTVSLKTVGLLVLMNQCGLAIPVKKGSLGYFKNIYVDIGDNQSLSDNLSTFSAHISQISEITKVVGGKDLVLFDELGTGTDPKEGEALALSVTKYLENKHALCMISSHFEALKEYAFTSEIIDNASMIFDEEHLLPTYRFHQGAAGHSYALWVAKKYSIDEGIIKNAEDYLSGQDKSDALLLMDTLQKKLDETIKLEEKLEKDKKDLEARLKKLESDESNLKIRRDKLLEDVKDEKEKLLKNAKEEISFILSKLNNPDVKLHEVIELKKQLDELEENEETPLYNEEIQVGDYVSIPSMNLNGKVERVSGNKAHINSDNGMSFDVSKDKLHKIQEPKKSASKVRKTNYDMVINTTVGLELNIIGQHVEEAQYALIKYLDNCRLKHLTTVRIIHGFGSGALRKMVRAYLDTQKDLTYRAGGEHEGAGGATVVTFKK